MVPIPPPPDYESTLPPPPPPPGPDQARTFPRPGELTVGWRWVLSLGWISVLVGMIAVADAARVIHKPPFWLDNGLLIVVPFALPLLTATAALINHRMAPWCGFLAVAALAIVAVVDRVDTPGVAAALGVLALVGLLTTLASLAGRMPGPST